MAVVISCDLLQLATAICASISISNWLAKWAVRVGVVNGRTSGFDIRLPVGESQNGEGISVCCKRRSPHSSIVIKKSTGDYCQSCRWQCFWALCFLKVGNRSSPWYFVVGLINSSSHHGITYSPTPQWNTALAIMRTSSAIYKKNIQNTSFNDALENSCCSTHAIMVLCIFTSCVVCLRKQRLEN